MVPDASHALHHLIRVQLGGFEGMEGDMRKNQLSGNGHLSWALNVSCCNEIV